MSSRREEIRNKAIELIKNNAKGIRYSELQSQLQEYFPDTPANTIAGSSWNLDELFPEQIYKPTRGLFKYRTTEDKEIEIIEKTSEKFNETSFYEPFAEWIKNDLAECSIALSLGGNYLNKKWGTPDVIGVYKPNIKDVVKFQPEIISAEIKINPIDPITAFGQAVAYRLFSHKVYLVEPNTISPEDLDRIEALCVLVGIGLILFDLNPDKPNFSIRVRSQKHIPDMYYVNELIDTLDKNKKDFINKLF